MSLIRIKEGNSYYHKEGLLDARKIQSVGHDLKKTHNFSRPSLIKQLCSATSRENIILYGLVEGEEPVSINQTKGNVLIPVINIDQIEKNISKTLCEKDRQKIGYIYISTIQLILKSTFALGISAPITLSLSDDRMIDSTNSLIADGSGNLAHGKIKFNLNYQVSMSLADADLERSITLRYQLKGNQLMKDNNHPFTITYKVNYALTNSHHSLSFKPGAPIEIDRLFKPVLQLDYPKRAFALTSSASSSRVQIDSDQTDSDSQKSLSFKIGGDSSEKSQPKQICEPLSQTTTNHSIRFPSDLSQRLKSIHQELGLP